MSRGRRWIPLPVALAALAGLIAPGVPSAQAAERPSVRVLAADPTITLERYGKRAWLDAGVYVAATGGPFEIRIRRPDYDHPMEVTQHAPGGDVALPTGLVRGLVGLRRFIHITVTDPKGRVVLDRYHAFCPGSAVRVTDEGPQSPTYVGYCYGSPFTLGTVWGIDEGWAMNATAYYGDPLKGPDGTYTVTVSIPETYASLFAIPDQDATTTVRVRLVTRSSGGGGGCPPVCEGDGPHHPHGFHGRLAPADGVPTLPSPGDDVLPDLVALPAWSILVERRRQGDFLDFGATVWNAGPAPMLVEGFRRSGDETMDAYQYFTDASGRVVGKAAAGDMMWDPRRGHQHWHFMQFARYSLLDATQTTTIVSRKEAFCLAPTDAIDLLIPGAEWNPGALGLGGSNCGSGPGALWVREVLPTGWGDTYFQGLPGQSFNITDLPNGTYYIAVEANPLGLLHERRTDNDLELREIQLGGTPGNRTVTVPPWHGIDTEGTGGGVGSGGVIAP
jgi:hypothetical protein